MGRDRRKNSTQGKPSSSSSGTRRGSAQNYVGRLPTKAEQLTAKATEAWRNNLFDDALRYYDRALEQEPTSAVLLMDAARAYALRYRHEEADRLIERAGRLHSADANLQRMLGRTYVQLQHYDRAIAAFRGSLDLEPDSPERARTLYELAHMYERLHQLDKARACAEESLTLAPNQHVLRYLLGVIDRRSGFVDAAVSRFQEVVGEATALPETVADAWYQLAAIHDQRGEYALAFDAANRAKQVLQKTAGRLMYDAADVSETNRRTFRTATAEHFERWAAAALNLKPLPSRLALLTSHPRSGTTLLEQVLDSHPDLISADERQPLADVVYLPLCRNWPVETPVPEILDKTSTAEVDALRQRYLAAMEGDCRQPIGRRTLVDKNPAVTPLLPLVARVFPETVIIFPLRDPRDVVVSCFMQQLPANPVSVHYFTLEETANHYAMTMRTWLKYRDLIRNPWLEVRYEDLVTDLETEARRVLEFLGLPWDERVLGYRERAQGKHVHSPTYEAVTKPLYTSSIGRWRNYAAQLEPCLKTLAPYVEAFGYEA